MRVVALLLLVGLLPVLVSCGGGDGEAAAPRPAFVWASVHE
jgi:hypothetical protein